MGGDDSSEDDGVVLDIMGGNDWEGVLTIKRGLVDGIGGV